MAQPPASTTPSNPPAPVAIVDSSGNFTPPIMSYSAQGGNASIAATIPAVPGQTSFITGYEISAGGSTGGSGVIATLTGIATMSGTAVVAGTLNYAFVAQATPLTLSGLQGTFLPPLPAFAPNTPITLTLPALGSGNLQATINVHGYSR